MSIVQFIDYIWDVYYRAGHFFLLMISGSTFSFNFLSFTVSHNTTLLASVFPANQSRVSLSLASSSFSSFIVSCFLKNEGNSLFSWHCVYFPIIVPGFFFFLLLRKGFLLFPRIIEKPIKLLASTKSQIAQNESLNASLDINPPPIILVVSSIDLDSRVRLLLKMFRKQLHQPSSRLTGKRHILKVMNIYSAIL